MSYHPSAMVQQPCRIYPMMQDAGWTYRTRDQPPPPLPPPKLIWKTYHLQKKLPKLYLQEEKRDELQKKLRQKICNSQQQLRRSKQKVKTMNEVINVLEEKSLITSKEAEGLQDKTRQDKTRQFIAP